MKKLAVAFPLLVVVVTATAMNYTPSDAVDYASDWWNGYNTEEYEDYSYPRGGDCANFVSQCLKAGFGGNFAWGDRFTLQEWVNWPYAPCKRPKYWVDKHGCLPNCGNLRNWTRYKLGCQSSWMGVGQRDCPSWARPGDIAGGNMGTLPIFAQPSPSTPDGDLAIPAGP